MSGSHLKDLTVALREAIELSKKGDFEANWKEIKDELTPSEIKKLLAIAKTKGNDNKKGRKGGKRRLVRDRVAGFIQRQLEAEQRLIKARQRSSFGWAVKEMEEAGIIPPQAEQNLEDIAARDSSKTSPKKSLRKKESPRKNKPSAKKPSKKKKPRRRRRSRARN